MATIPIPGLDALGCGYDIFGRYADTKSCKGKLFNLGRNDTEVVIEGATTADTKSYWRPAAVDVLKAYEAYSRIAWGESIEEYQASLSVDVKLSGGYAGFTASVSTSFNKTERRKQENAFSTLRNVIHYYALRLPAAAQLRSTLSKEAEEALASMSPEELFDTYGTHYVSSLIAGAHANYTCVTNKTTFASSTSLDVAVSASYGSMVSGSVDVKTKQTVDRFRSASDIRIQAFGGRPELATGILAKADGGWKSYDAWVASVPTALVFADFVDGTSLVPIWMLAATAPRRAQLKEAFDAYLKRHAVLEGPLDLELKLTDKFVKAADDRGLGSKLDLATYVPALPSGYCYVGQYAQGDWRPPTGRAVIVRDKTPDKSALKPPTGYTKLWGDHGSRKKDSYSCWRPIAPPGYVALGDLFQHANHYNPPVLRDLVCVRKDLVTRGTLGAPIWDDHGSRARADLTLYRIDPVDDEAVSAGTFFGFPRNRSTPPGEQTVYCLLGSGRSAKKTVQAETRRFAARARARRKKGEPSPFRSVMRVKGLKIGPKKK